MSELNVKTNRSGGDVTPERPQPFSTSQTTGNSIDMTLVVLLVLTLNGVNIFVTFPNPKHFIYFEDCHHLEIGLLSFCH